jgi:hypothetical protein
MVKWLALALASGALHAAVIRGTVVEGQSGRPLARTLVTLEPVPGTAAQAASTRTNQYGAFGFSELAAGSYLITASRLGFAPVQYGQKRWKAAGVPVPVDSNGSANLIIRLPRLGAVTGTVLDENDVGLPEHDVVAYRAARPLQVAARARTDDRGRYRLWGLEPGRYFVRTAAKEYDDGGYVPTFHRDALRIEGATTVDVELDRETADINVQAISGRLVNISGHVAPPAQINVTLVSDTGAETATSDPLGNFRFNPVAPGAYELYAQAPADSKLGIQAAYLALNVNSDRSDLRLTLRPLPQLQFIFRDTNGQLIDYRAVRVMARRKDLAGTGKTQTLELAGDRLAFLPGRWELALAPAPGLFVSSLSPSRPQLGEPARADGWNEFLINGSGDQLQFVLSATPGAVHGTVMGPGHVPAAGAPVYLEAFDPNARRRVKDLQITHADARGQYHFADLAPGSYRLLSSFDFDAPDGLLEIRGAKTLKVDEARDLVQDLELL